jgi:acetolactate synthase I/II/III large subunit
MNTAEALVKALETEGVTHIFGLPGEENLDFLAALSHSSMRFVLVRHEQEAGFMAATWGRLSGKAGVCFSTLGPGATNLMTAAAYAQLGGMPMIMITGQKPILHSKQAAFQILDTVDMMKPVTKASQRLHDGSWLPSMIHNAFRQAEGSRAGAFHLELPEDVAAEKATQQPYPGAQRLDPAQATGAQIEAALQRLTRARCPVLMIGAGAQREPITQALATFIDQAQVPFFSSQMGKGVLDERHPLCLGTAALSEGEIAHEALEHSDLVITLGHDLVEKPPFHMQVTGPEVLHLHTDPAQFDPLYFPQSELLGCMVHSLTALAEGFAVTSPHWDFTVLQPFLKKYQQRLSAVLAPATIETTDTQAVTPYALIQSIRHYLPENSLVALDNGMYKLWFARYYPAFERHNILLDNALASMGAGLPSAMAAKLMFPDKAVMAVCGDGGFLMNSQSLETAVRLELNLTTVILNDGALGMIRWKQEKEKQPHFGLSFQNPDFVQLAQSYGATGHRIESVQALRTHFENHPVKKQRGVHVIEVAIDYQDNQKEF